MKLLLFLLLFPIFCSAQFGVWGLGGLGTNNDIKNYANLHTPAAWNGYQVDIPWSEIETTEGVYDFSSLDSKTAQVRDSGLLVGVSVPVNQDCPSWLKTRVGTYTTGSVTTYPKAYDSRYKTAFARLCKKLSEHIASLGYVYEWQFKWGTTGDTGPWHGTLGNIYLTDLLVPQGDDDTWKAWYHPMWDTVIYWSNFYHLDTNATHLLFNPGNDHEDNALVWSKSHSYYIKEGNSSHTYVFDAMGIYDSLLEPQKSRGEVQGNIFTSLHKHKDTWQLIVNATRLDLNMLNTGGSWQTNFGTDTRPQEFFNRYADDSLAYTSNQAFIGLGCWIDPMDTVRWTQSAFGKLIKNSDLTAYNNAISNVNSDPNTSADYKAYLRVTKVINFTNQNRLDSLLLYSGTNCKRLIGAANDWDNDFAWKSIDNSGKFIKQNNSVTTSVPSYRDGVDSSIYGRLDKQFKITGGVAPDMTFDIDDNWDSATAVANVTFKIAYLDYGGGSWSFLADTSGSGKVPIFIQSNLPTSNQWIVKTVTLNNMRLGTSDDFHLHYIGGGNTKFAMIEIEGKAVSLYTFYQDADGDGFGNGNVSTQAASQPSGYVDNTGDCNDNNASIHPGATEVCNGLDDNCDGFVDEGAQSIFYRDSDNDGYGDINITTQDCSVPSGYSANSTDCNDGNSNIHPGATEICDGVDNNCDGTIDEGCGIPNLSIADTSVNESTGTVQIRVYLSAISSQNVKVDYTSYNILATAPKDYKAVKSTLTIPAGSLSANITIQIVKDKISEPTETFGIKLSNSRNATLVDNRGVISIINL